MGNVYYLLQNQRMLRLYLTFLLLVGCALAADVQQIFSLFGIRYVEAGVEQAVSSAF
jgi:hypothetical protein